MRTTVNIDDELLKQARQLTGITEKTRLLHDGLRALVHLAASRRLAALGGSDPKASAGPRRRSEKKS